MDMQFLPATTGMAVDMGEEATVDTKKIFIIPYFIANQPFLCLL